MCIKQDWEKSPESYKSLKPGLWVNAIVSVYIMAITVNCSLLFVDYYGLSKSAN